MARQNKICFHLCTRRRRIWTVVAYNAAAPPSRTARARALSSLMRVHDLDVRCRWAANISAPHRITTRSRCPWSSSSVEETPPLRCCPHRLCRSAAALRTRKSVENGPENVSYKWAGPWFNTRARSLLTPKQTKIQKLSNSSRKKREKEKITSTHQDQHRIANSSCSTGSHTHHER